MNGVPPSPITPSCAFPYAPYMQCKTMKQWNYHQSALAKSGKRAELHWSPKAGGWEKCSTRVALSLPTILCFSTIYYPLINFGNRRHQLVEVRWVGGWTFLDLLCIDQQVNYSVEHVWLIGEDYHVLKEYDSIAKYIINLFLSLDPRQPTTVKATIDCC